MKESTKSLFFITGNSHKFQEVSTMVHGKGLDYSILQADLAPIEIQAEDLTEVARFKLESVRDQLEGSCFVEDAGFFVDEPLKGFPGVYSSYVQATLGNEGILRLITDFEHARAHFSAVIALYFKPKDEIVTFEGKVSGSVSSTMRGNQGFGFDPIFVPDEIPGKTFAELTTSEKNEISHRSRALEGLLRFLRNA